MVPLPIPICFQAMTARWTEATEKNVGGYLLRPRSTSSPYEDARCSRVRGFSNPLLSNYFSVPDRIKKWWLSCLSSSRAERPPSLQSRQAARHPGTRAYLRHHFVSVVRSHSYCDACQCCQGLAQGFHHCRWRHDSAHILFHGKGWHPRLYRPFWRRLHPQTLAA